MEYLKLVRAALAAIVLTVSATTASAATIGYEWTLSFGGDSVSGSLSGLIDNTAGQSVSGASITSSTLGGVGALDLTAAKKNSKFEVVNGVIVNGNLQFKNFGAGTAASPMIDFQLKWKNGVLKSAFFTADNGQPNGITSLTMKTGGTTFYVSAIPLPPALPMLAAGLGGLMLVRRRRLGKRRVATA